MWNNGVADPHEMNQKAPWADGPDGAKIHSRQCLDRYTKIAYPCLVDSQ